MVLEAIQDLKLQQLHKKASTLSLDELMIALSISALTNPTAKLAYHCLSQLANAEAHSTVILSKQNQQTLKQLGINITQEPHYPERN